MTGWLNVAPTNLMAERLSSVFPTADDRHSRAIGRLPMRSSLKPSQIGPPLSWSSLLACLSGFCAISSGLHESRSLQARPELSGWERTIFVLRNCWAEVLGGDP